MGHINATSGNWGLALRNRADYGRTVTLLGSQVLGRWSQVSGRWSLVSGLRFQELGFWWSGLESAHDVVFIVL